MSEFTDFSLFSCIHRIWLYLVALQAFISALTSLLMSPAVFCYPFWWDGRVGYLEISLAVSVLPGLVPHINGLIYICLQKNKHAHLRQEFLDSATMTTISRLFIS